MLVFIAPPRARGEAMDHTLLFGPPGLGKTTLAQIIAGELGVGFRATSGPVIAKAGDLAALLTNLEPHDVLFIDEIHRLAPGGGGGALPGDGGPRAGPDHRRGAVRALRRADRPGRPSPWSGRRRCGRGCWPRRCGTGSASRSRLEFLHATTSWSGSSLGAAGLAGRGRSMPGGRARTSSRSRSRGHAPGGRTAAAPGAGLRRWRPAPPASPAMWRTRR